MPVGIRVSWAPPFWPARQGSRLYSVFSTSPAAELTNLRALGVDALAFTIGPNSSRTFALELDIGRPVRPDALAALGIESQKGEFAFFRGAILGIAMLLGIAIVSFFFVRQKAVFLAALGFRLVRGAVSRRRGGILAADPELVAVWFEQAASRSGRWLSV